jgi:hypothetical protein
MLELVALLLSLAQAPVATPAFPPIVKAAAFRASEQVVDNWQTQAVLDLDLRVTTALSWLAGKAPANLPRCIRLNNYWCIKKAGWSGEIGADPEGHVAFASAREGAVVAILLLRRYYLQYGRKSARAILAHWAPAQCPQPVVASGDQLSFSAPSLVPLAKHGLGNTLRARWLAAHGRGGTVRTRMGAREAAPRRSVVPDRPSRAIAAPKIALGGASPEPPLVLEPPIKTEALRSASTRGSASSRHPALLPGTPVVAATPLLPGVPPRTGGCPAEGARLANYAAHAIEGIARSEDEDLKLFGADGRPLAALPRLLANMAAVEIGPYRADTKLIEAAVEAVRNEPPHSEIVAR